MTPAMPGGIGFLRASVQVPSDAHVMDLVFSDTGDMHGGFYDNNGGLDYHVDVQVWGERGACRPDGAAGAQGQGCCSAAPCTA